MIDVKIQESPLNTAESIAKVIETQSGGISVFIGTVRNNTDGKTVKKLVFEAYDDMALNEMHKIADTAVAQWNIHGILIHHRSGSVKVGETAVIIAVSAAHRDAAFKACRYAIDTLKETVPIWKKEFFTDGAQWVSAHP